MDIENRKQIPQIINFKLILFFGLILSETQLLINLKDFLDIYNVPYFILFYFCLTTFYLVYIFISYAFRREKQKALSIELIEHLLIPLSVFFLTLLVRVEDYIMFKIICAILLLTQSFLIILKIVYFGNIISELAQISSINKIIRIVKLNIIAIVPMILTAKIVVVVTISLCQFICAFAFCFKFTYQKIINEYILLVGIFCGVISGIQAVFQVVFNLPYFFVGQVMSLYFYWSQQNYMKSIVQLKYTHNFTAVLDNKQDEDDLTNFLFLNECIFARKRTINLSRLTKNEGNIQLQTLVNGFYNMYGQKINQDLQQIIKNQSELKKSLISIYSKFLQNTQNFQALQFLINSALELQGSFINKALVVYYNHIERYQKKRSIFQKCKYQFLFQRIRSHIDCKNCDSQQIKYIQFSNSLRELNGSIQKCIKEQIDLFEYLSQSDNSKDFTIQDRLMSRNATKKEIRQIFSSCYKSRFYLSSNQFKFLFILYEITVQKNYQSLKEQMKKSFLSNEVQKLGVKDHLKSLVVLSGFNHGEIINSNQNFKNYIASSFNSFGKNNISDLIPSAKQRQKHLELMIKQTEFKIQNPNCHSGYQCWLLLEKEVNSVKIKIMKKFNISVRFYYENSSSFNYICSLFHEQKIQESKGDYFLLKKDCEGLVNKGVELVILNRLKLQQLGQKFQIYQIQLKNHQNISIKTLQNKFVGDNTNRIINETDELIKQKTTQIELKMMNIQQSQVRPCLNCPQIIPILILIALVFSVFLFISSSVDDLSFVILHKQTPVQQAQLIHSRLMLEQQILSFNMQTSFFPDDICSAYKIPSIFDYTYQKALDDLYNNTDQFFKLITLPNHYGILDRNIYTRNHSSRPYMKNYQSLTSFQKHVQFMKMETFDWLTSLNQSSLDIKFYQNVFPLILLGSTFDAPSALSSIMDDDKQIYVSDLLNTISTFKTLASIGIVLTFVLISFFRIRDNYNLVQYFIVIEAIKGDILRNGIMELKSAVTQINKLNANHIDSVQFTNELDVAIKFDKATAQNISIQNFSEWHTSSQMNKQTKNEDDDDQASQFSQFIKFRDRDNISFVTKSKLIRVIMYKKIYLIIIILVFLSVIILSNIILAMQINRISTISKCDDAKAEFNNIQQKMINIVAYNWLKVLSLRTNFTMTASNKMFLEAINFLMVSKFVNNIQNSYVQDKIYSNSILYDNICRFFKNQTECNHYRNGIFSSGFSMLVPFVVKQQLQEDQASTNYTYYISNLCDKTWLLFQGILPMTLQIPREAYIRLTDQASSGFFTYLSSLVSALILSLLVTVYFQNKRYTTQRTIRQETLSLDTIKNLYSISQFKLYFNQIFYS